MNTAFEQIWYAPAFSSLLENRREGLVLFGAGALHLGLNLAGLPSWSCPIRAATGIPCPGCGITRATMQLLHGDLGLSLQTHAFAPVLVLALVFMTAGLFLPKRNRELLIAAIKKAETRYGLTAYLAVVFMLYWVVRLMGILPFPKFF
jgi:hypothetical protein